MKIQYPRTLVIAGLMLAPANCTGAPKQAVKPSADKPITTIVILTAPKAAVTTRYGAMFNAAWRRPKLFPI